ncbi:MAG: hypothetical protein ACOY5B_02710 [Spirochaetota bacterium]
MRPTEPQNDQYPAPQPVPELERLAAELRQRLTTGCALPAAERAQIKARLAVVQGQLEQQRLPGRLTT